MELSGAKIDSSCATYKHTFENDMSYFMELSKSPKIMELVGTTLWSCPGMSVWSCPNYGVFHMELSAQLPRNYRVSQICYYGVVQKYGVTVRNYGVTVHNYGVVCPIVEFPTQTTP